MAFTMPQVRTAKYLLSDTESELRRKALDSSNSALGSSGR